MKSTLELSPEIQVRATALHADHNDQIRVRTDRLFAALLIAEWLAGIVVALIISPLTWAGIESTIHIHVWAAVGLGSAIVLIPAGLGLIRPGYAATRHVIAISQMMIGALLIHLTGGRIETHFHVFGSLAFLAFYRDWRVLLTATVVVATDHILRGIYYPQSIYGVLGGAEWRWVEHAGWVVFENLFLGISCIQAQREMAEIAVRHAQLEVSSRALAETVEESRLLAAKNEQLAIQAMTATKAKSEFLATMSHELRTPMNAIINYADLAIRRSAKAIPSAPDPAALQQQHRFATEIRTAGERLLSLINQLLDLSRIEAGRVDVHVEEASGAEVIERVRKIADPLMEANENTFMAHSDPDIRLRTDVQKLEQCLINLLGNAAKFTHRGRITLRMVCGSTPDRLVITVRDTGIGMTPDQMDRLFVAFNQADSSITREYGGSGLGLAITKSILAMLGGTITVQSERYQGSVFTIEMPMEQDQATLSVRAAQQHDELADEGTLKTLKLDADARPGTPLPVPGAHRPFPTLTPADEASGTVPPPPLAMAPAPVGRGSQFIAFLTEFFRDPVHLGAIAPSGHELARMMVRAADIGPGEIVIELGAGTGPMTQQILATRPEGPFVALEPNPSLAAVLRQRFPGLWVDQRPAQMLRDIVADLGATQVDCVVSSLPWAAWSAELQAEVLSAITDVLAPDGRLVTFGYLHAQILPAAQRLRANLAMRFHHVRTTRIAWMNLPPAQVFVCDHPRQPHGTVTPNLGPAPSSRGGHSIPNW